MWQEILSVDRNLLLALNGDGGAFWDQFFFFVSEKLTWIPLYILLVYVMWRTLGLRRMLFALLFLVLAVVCVDQIANLFKHGLPKFRPSRDPAIASLVHTVNGYRGGLYGTVSAHAGISFAVAIFTSLLFARRWYTWSIFAWALLVSYSRIYLGVHFPLDLLFGALLGTLIGWLAFRAFRQIKA